MGKDVAVRPAGCVCPWAQVHMDLPWQRLSAAMDCPVHGGSKALIGEKAPESQEQWVEPERDGAENLRTLDEISGRSRRGW